MKEMFIGVAAALGVCVAVGIIVPVIFLLSQAWWNFLMAHLL